MAVDREVWTKKEPRSSLPTYRQWIIFLLASGNSIPFFYCAEGPFVPIFFGLSCLGYIITWLSYFQKIWEKEEETVKKEES